MLFDPSTFYLNYPKDNKRNFYRLLDSDLISMLLYGEARGSSDEVKRCIGMTIISRCFAQEWYGRSIRGVIFKPYQYSCFNPNDVNFDKIQNPEEYGFEPCIRIAREIYNLYTMITDATYTKFFPTHYHTIKEYRERPDWSNKYNLIKELEGFYFYKAEKL